MVLKITTNHDYVKISVSTAHAPWKLLIYYIWNYTYLGLHTVTVTKLKSAKRNFVPLKSFAKKFKGGVSQHAEQFLKKIQNCLFNNKFCKLMIHLTNFGLYFYFGIFRTKNTWLKPFKLMGHQFLATNFLYMRFWLL